MLNKVEAEARQFREADVAKTEALTRADLERVVVGQVERYIALGFYAEVYPGIEEEEAKAKYRADFTLPENAAQPVKYSGRFDVVLAVEPRISLTRKHELAARIKELGLDTVARRWTTSRVREWINTGNIEDLTDHPTNVPYLVFTYNGKKHRLNTVTRAEDLFAGDEVRSPQLEVTDLFLQIPRFFVSQEGLYAAGSRYGRVLVPRLGTLFDEPEVQADSSDYRPRGWGVASRGKDVIRLGTR